jgi:phosphoribosylglycinamide formyltransferase-1
MNFAVLASGNGSNLQAIIKAVKAKQIKANLVLVFSDKADAFALTRARKARIPAHVLNPKEFSDRESFDRALIDLLRQHKVDFIVLAGFMRILSPLFIRAYANKILNIHPSLLPAFKGGQAIRDAFDYGVKVTGVTVHFVDEEIDHGAVILQEAVPVLPNDTLQKLEQKIHRAEHKIYSRAIHLFATGKLKIEGRSVKVR